jgi:hypothetical protein
MIEQNLILYLTPNGNSMYKDFRNWNHLESEFEYLSNYARLKGAVLKGKLWTESNDWKVLEKKLKKCVGTDIQFVGYL